MIRETGTCQCRHNTLPSSEWLTTLTEKSLFPRKKKSLTLAGEWVRGFKWSRRFSKEGVGRAKSVESSQWPWTSDVGNFVICYHHNGFRPAVRRRRRATQKMKHPTRDLLEEGAVDYNKSSSEVNTTFLTRQLVSLTVYTLRATLLVAPVTRTWTNFRANFFVFSTWHWKKAPTTHSVVLFVQMRIR